MPRTTKTLPERRRAFTELRDDVTVTLDASGKAIERARRLRAAAQQARDQARTARLRELTNLNRRAPENPTSRSTAA